MPTIAMVLFQYIKYLLHLFVSLLQFLAFLLFPGLAEKFVYKKITIYNVNNPSENN